MFSYRTLFWGLDTFRITFGILSRYRHCQAHIMTWPIYVLCEHLKNGTSLLDISINNPVRFLYSISISGYNLNVTTNYRMLVLSLVTIHVYTDKCYNWI
jgi:hypothetical protein